MAGPHPCMGALCTCTMGAAPTPLVVLPLNMEISGVMPGATIMDNKPIMNIVPFGVCRSPAYPPTAAATAAAFGALTPMPCMPTTPAPWVPGNPMVTIKGQPALTSSSQLACIWGGMISISFPGQLFVQV